MTLFSRVRTLPAEAPSARLMYRSERAYWRAVGLLMGRVKVEMLRRTICA